MASEGNVCSANSELYVGANTAAAYGNGSTLNFTQSDVEIIGNAGSSLTLAIGASNDDGTTGVTPGATVNGINLKVVSSSAQNSRAIYIGGIDSNTRFISEYFTRDWKFNCSWGTQEVAGPQFNHLTLV